MDHLHQESKVSVGPSTGSFTPGLALHGHVRFGTEYDNEVAHMPEDCRKAAVVFGLKLTLSNPSAGPQAVETLNQLKEMAVGIDQVKEALDRGVDVSFRHEESFVYINVRVPETLPELQGIPGWDKIDMSKCVFSGKSDVKFTSGADPTKLLTTTVDEIIERVSHFSLEVQANFEELHHVITAVVSLLRELLPSNKKVEMGLAAASILTAFKSMNLDFKYDPDVIRNVVSNVLKASGRYDRLTGTLTGTQEMGNGFLPQAQMMAPMFIGPYADLLKSVDLGHYEVFFMVPRLRLYYNPGFTLFGLNQFLTENFLSQ